jgi:hypothetical protein
MGIRSRLPFLSLWAVVLLLIAAPRPLLAQTAAQLQPRAQSQPADADEHAIHPLHEIGDAMIRLPLAALLGTALALRPKRRGTPPRTPAVVQTQIVLAVVGAIVMLVVGASLARAFGIVGAANLVRYRSKIDDPKDRSTGKRRDTCLCFGSVRTTAQICRCLARDPQRGHCVAPRAFLLRHHGAVEQGNSFALSIMSGYDPPSRLLQFHLMSNPISGRRWDVVSDGDYRQKQVRGPIDVVINSVQNGLAAADVIGNVFSIGGSGDAGGQIHA